jgi:hypothetical protein
MWKWRGEGNPQRSTHVARWTHLYKFCDLKASHLGLLRLRFLRTSGATACFLRTFASKFKIYRLLLQFLSTWYTLQTVKVWQANWRTCDAVKTETSPEYRIMFVKCMEFFICNISRIKWRKLHFLYFLFVSDVKEEANKNIVYEINLHRRGECLLLWQEVSR